MKEPKIPPEVEAEYEAEVAEEKKKRSPGFWKETNWVTDSGVAALIGSDAMTVWRCMRRHVWKETKFGDPRLRNLYSLDESGYRTLAMNRSIGEIARETGIEKRAVMKAIKKLLDLTLVFETHQACGNTPAIFAVGIRDATDKEYYFLESVAEQAWDAIESQAKAEGVKGGRNVDWATRSLVAKNTLLDYASRLTDDSQEKLVYRTRAVALLDSKKKPRGNPKWDRNADWADAPNPWRKHK